MNSTRVPTVDRLSPVAVCMVPDCEGDPNVDGTARGFCVRHYNRYRRHGPCQVMAVCLRPAVSYLGFCELHDPGLQP